MRTVNLYSLPTEIIYHILDFLDAETIFLAFRILCRRFHAIAHTYNHVELDFRAFSKGSFDRICRLVRGENVTGLILSDDERTPGQIDRFLSLIDFDRFTRLHSLRLHAIDQPALNAFLRSALPRLVRLSIEQRNRCVFDVATTNLLSSTIATLPRLEQLHLAVEYNFVESPLWLQNAAINSLSLNQCTLQQLIVVLQGLPQLHTLVLHNVYGTHTAHSLETALRFTSSVKSLTMELKHISMSVLQSLLSVTPSLVYLQVTGRMYQADRTFDGSQWETFIQMSLAQLVKFEFFWSFYATYTLTIADLESILAAFRTPFWLDVLRLYVACDYNSNLNLCKCYSLPCCASSFEYEYQLDRISCSTMPVPAMPDTASLMDNVKTLNVDLFRKKNDHDPTAESSKYAVPWLFSRVTKLAIWVVHQHSSDSVEHLASIIDLSHVRAIHLHMHLDQKSHHEGKRLLQNLSKRMPNVDTVEVPYPLHSDTNGQNMDLLCLMLSDRVKHLKAGIYNLREMQGILERYPHLFSVEFESLANLSDAYAALLQWLKQRGTQFTYAQSDRSLALWLNCNPVDED